MEDARFLEIAEQTIDIFPEESKELFYTSRGATTTGEIVAARGVYYEKYNDLKKPLRDNGIIKSKQRKKKPGKKSTGNF